VARGVVKSASRPADIVAAAVALAPPSGMRDLLPEEAAIRASLRKQVSDVVALFGYEPIVTPIFEMADVIERGLDAVDRRDLLRFVEPDTGEVALLRPDITPQVARIVATTLRSRPAPFRLSYEGTVIRRRRGRARLQRQIYQLGGECIGPKGPSADVEVIELAARAAEATGLRDYRIELAQVKIGRAALHALPESIRDAVAESLARKDAYAIEQDLVSAGVKKSDRAEVLALAGLWGDTDVIKRARKVLTGKRNSADLDELEAVADRLGSVGLCGSVGIDLGELRGQAYYTGVSFTLLADGPGEPVGGGGRYDRLLERFDLDCPATGFALDLDHLEWALRAAGAPIEPDRPIRFVVFGAAKPVAATASLLRGAFAAASTLADATEGDALAYAAAWGYDCALHASPRGLHATRTADHSRRALRALDAATIDETVAWLRSARAARRT